MLSSLPLLPEPVRHQPMLVVDDSLFQREVVVALLAEFGVLDIGQAANGQQALQILRAHRAQPPLLVLDLEMPELDGIALLQLLAEEHIYPQVIIASGRESSLVSTVESMLQASGLPLLGSLAKPMCGAKLWNLLAKQGEGAAPVSATPKAARQIAPEQLEQAIDSGRIKPYYQPKVALQDGRLCGYEALARWIDGSGQVISPLDFIPLANRSGLLNRLTFSLLEQILADLRTLGPQTLMPSMALNLDISLLAERGFADQLIEGVRVGGSNPSQWVLEVTESALMHDPAVTLGTVGRLRLAGFGLAIDDYGTGFSTLQQLSRLPFSELKIDRSFVAEAQHNSKARSILHAAIEMGRSLHLPCVAEGVEHRADALLLRQLGCYAAQGYLFARPLPASEWLQWHRAHCDVSSLEQWFVI